jgi:hypothetical protein
VWATASRALHSGNALAFQARVAGSIPAARSKKGLILKASFVTRSATVAIRLPCHAKTVLLRSLRAFHPLVDGRDFHGKHDGAGPRAPLLALDGKLYGATDSGGEGGSSCDYYCGTLFAVTTSGHEKVLHRFAGGSDGSNPSSGLIDIGGDLYGTTGYLGASGGCCGTVFKATTSGTESAIYNFKGPPDASAPNGMLVTDHGLLYGTASGGESCGYSDSGTIFAVSTAGAERVDHTFSCYSASAQPSPGLLLLDRTFYGATFSGYGTVFAFTP